MCQFVIKVFKFKDNLTLNWVYCFLRDYPFRNKFTKVFLPSFPKYSLKLHSMLYNFEQRVTIIDKYRILSYFDLVSLIYFLYSFVTFFRNKCTKNYWKLRCVFSGMVDLNPKNIEILPKTISKTKLYYISSRHQSFLSNYFCRLRYALYWNLPSKRYWEWRD